jgi:DNA polymerase III subunit delta
MDALDFLDKAKKAKAQPYYVLSGDEDFLKRQVLEVLQPLILEEADPEYSVTTYTGEDAPYSTVRNELDSVSFFSRRRLVIVDRADDFVSEYRPQLEAYVAAPSEVGVLILDVKSFPGNTKLAKLVPSESHIVCKGPPEFRLPMWCQQWCQSRYGKKIPSNAAQMLVQYAGSSMGVLDQELHKLSDFVGGRSSIEAKDVDELVGRSRGAVIFKMFDAIGEGKPVEALKILEICLEQDEAMKILGGISYQLRKLAKVNRLVAQGTPLDDAIARSGIPPFNKDSARRQVRHLGRGRLEKVFDWLIDLDGGLKGGNPLPDRLQLERLVVRLAKERPS